VARNVRDFEALSFDCYGTLIEWETGIAAVLTMTTFPLSAQEFPQCGSIGVMAGQAGARRYSRRCQSGQTGYFQACPSSLPPLSRTARRHGEAEQRHPLKRPRRGPLTALKDG
jgi:hypothetical protein